MTDKAVKYLFLSSNHPCLRCINVSNHLVFIFMMIHWYRINTQRATVNFEPSRALKLIQSAFIELHRPQVGAELIWSRPMRSLDWRQSTNEKPRSCHHIALIARVWMRGGGSKWPTVTITAPVYCLTFFLPLTPRDSLEIFMVWKLFGSVVFSRV